MAELGERILQLGPALGPGVIDAVDVLELLALLVADPRIHEDQAVVVLDQQAPQRQTNPVPRVGDDTAFPQGLGHHAEHGAAVEPLGARLQGVTLEPADSE